MKAIETFYRGYRFRSRLEARWAVFFDFLKAPFEYEPQGFHTDHGPYLPDFFLTELKLWVEVKAKPARHMSTWETPEEKKMASLVQITGYLGTVVYGNPERQLKEWCYRYDNEKIDELICGIYDTRDSDFSVHFPEGGSDHPYYFCICPSCGKLGFEFDGRAGRIDCKCNVAEKCYTADHDKIIDACFAARRARFEHGEKPHVI